MSCSKVSSPTELRLQNKINMLEHQLEKLQLNEQRHRIEMSFTDIVTFDYDINSGAITTGPNDFEEFGMPNVHENGVEDIIGAGVITPRSIPAFRELYCKIDSGEPSASATVVALDAKGEERFLELDLVTIFDKAGKPLRAVGVRKDITERMLLQKEKQYGDSLASLRNLSFEANITTDRTIHINADWAMQLGLIDVASFSELIDFVLSGKTIHPDHKEMLRNGLLRENIIGAFQNGRRLLSFEYLKALDGKNYEWYEQTVNIIKDRLTGDIITRNYVVNIHERKRRELYALEEKQHFEMMRTKSSVIYEFNITKNAAVSGHEKLVSSYNISHGGNYTHLLSAIAENTIDSEDRSRFIDCFSRDNIIRQHEDGKDELTCEFKALNSKGEYIWVRCTMRTFEDPQTNDLRGFAYLENINIEKQRELNLLYKAQHDMLTGFYDKATAKEKIDEFLLSAEGTRCKHAFFILDIDRFKSINDTFGHAFGDTVLARTAQKLSTLFRKTDLLCRIGGDEFAILMKDIRSYKTALLKAQEMCDAVSDMYNNNGIEYNLSISVGIAYYNRHGKNYDELYNRSDAALYYAKEHGRNRFALYHPNIRENITNIKDSGRQLLFQSNTFSETISEYVFRTLYEAEDKDAAIYAALELIGKHYNISRAYIFENSGDDSFTSNTYEWCNAGIPPQMEALQSIPFSELGQYSENFNDEGVFYLPDITQTEGTTHAILERQNIKSLVQVSIVQNGSFVGFIGFDQCDALHVPSLKELWDYRNVANLLSMFIAEMRTAAESRSMRDMAFSIVNGLNSYAYVCDPETHRLLFINEEAMRLSHEARIGDYCYRAFFGLARPCARCPMYELEKGKGGKLSMDLYNFSLDMWFRSTASRIDWLDEKCVCLIDNVDITKYRQEWGV